MSIRSLIKIIWENGPTLGFWLGVLVWFQNEIQISPFIKFLIVASLFVITALAIRKIYREYKQELLKYRIDSHLEKVKGNEDLDKVKNLQKNIPTSTEINDIHSYSEEYAKNWASDGGVTEINYYLDAVGSRVNKSVQIYMFSSIRSEKLALYLPKYSTKLEEHRVFEPPVSISKLISSFSNWSDALSKAIEMCSSDIAKSDISRIQISPTHETLYFNFYFTLSNRQWRRIFTLRGNKLFEDDKEVFSY